MPFFGPVQLSQPASGGDPRLIAFLQALTQRGAQNTLFPGPGGAGVSAVGYQAPQALTAPSGPLDLNAISFLEPSGGVPTGARPAGSETLTGHLSATEFPDSPGGGGIGPSVPTAPSSGLAGQMAPSPSSAALNALSFGLMGEASPQARAAGFIGSAATLAAPIPGLGLVAGPLAAAGVQAATNEARGLDIARGLDVAYGGTGTLGAPNLNAPSPVSGAGLFSGVGTATNANPFSSTFGLQVPVTPPLGVNPSSAPPSAAGIPADVTEGSPIGLSGLGGAPASAPTADASVSEGSPVGVSGLGDAGGGGGGGGGK